MTTTAKLLVFASLIALPCFLPAADTAALAKRLHNAADNSSLDDPSLKPWHLKLNVQLYDTKGSLSEQGTIEEWWSPDASKRVYNTPSYSAEEISNGKVIYRTKGKGPAPFLLYTALNFVVHPMLSSQMIDNSDASLQEQDFGNVKLDCIVLFKLGRSQSVPPVGVVPTACLDTGTDYLRAVWSEPLSSTRNSVALFQGRRAGANTTILVDQVKAITQHLAELDSNAIEPTTFMPDQEVEERPSDPVWVTTAEGGKALHTEPPVFPNVVKLNHISGSVLVIATVGIDGHVMDAEVFGNPAPILTASSIDSVKRMTFAPYMLNGVATKTRRIVTIHVVNP